MAPRDAGCHPPATFRPLTCDDGLSAMNWGVRGKTQIWGEKRVPNELRLNGKWSTMKASAPPCG